MIFKFYSFVSYDLQGGTAKIMAFSLILSGISKLYGSLFANKAYVQLMYDVAVNPSWGHLIVLPVSLIDSYVLGIIISSASGVASSYDRTVLEYHQVGRKTSRVAQRCCVLYRGLR